MKPQGDLVGRALRPRARSLKTAGLLLLGIAWLLGCSEPDPAHGGSLPRGRVTIQGQTIEVEVARTPATRQQGLSGRTRLEPGTGMLFLHTDSARHAYWMKDMSFAIDILWMRGGRIVYVIPRVPPPAPGRSDASLRTYDPPIDSDVVLELPAGTARTRGFEVGQHVAIEVDDAGGD